MAPSIRVNLFGGQGSNSLFPSTVLAANTTLSPLARLLLGRCHTAFIGDVLNLPAENQDKLLAIRTPDGLLAPPVALQTHPIIQGITLCLHQLLTFLDYSLSTENNVAESHPLQAADESVGFCSGVLPASAVSLATTVGDYFEIGVHIFRIAFWIGYRVGEDCETLEGSRWGEHGAWAVAIMRKELDLLWLEEIIAAFNNSPERTSPTSSVCVASISGPSTATLAGPPMALESFRTQYSDVCSFESIPVNGLYHGGQRYLTLVQRILGDCQAHGIALPPASKLRSPLRLASSGAFVEPDSGSLLKLVLQEILVKPVQWRSCWGNIIAQAAEETPLEVQIHGPFSRSLTKANASVQIIHNELEVPPPATSEGDVAIVGMSFNFPIGSEKDAFWASLRDGIDSIQNIDDARIEISQGFEKEAAKKPKYGNFLETPWSLDHKYFNISPREAKSMDPQQRQLLHSAVHALDDAGYTPNATPTFQQDTMGCYVGVATNDYVDNLREDIDVYYSTGTLHAFLSGKISYAFKFSGPSIVIDTACSSSTVAIYQACRALVAGDCSAALAGGVNTITSSDMYTGLSKAHFLSGTGQCKAFDASADGYCRAEGCGLFVLKRLADAIAENDRVYGVIRGIEVNQCGNAHSITHPHQETQQALFRRLLSNTGVPASSVGVVEAHGTGTQAGDAAEISSLKSVFGSPHRQPMYITSVKANMGHAEAASGAAGLTKLLLMMKMQQIPQQANLTTLNPRLHDMSEHGLSITRKTIPWSSKLEPRRALLNNFGAAGSNAALLLEEHRGVSTEVALERSAYPLIISARSKSALLQLQDSYLTLGFSSVRDLCYTATARRQRHEYALSAVCSSWNSLDALNQCHTAMIEQKERRVVFVFSGQGAVHSGMGKELLATSSIFREIILTCEELLKQREITILPVIQGYDGGDVVASQCALFALEYALAELWRSWNIVPDLVLGHSLGEYAAMVQAGVVTLRNMLDFVAARASLMKQHCPQGTAMLACNIASEKAAQFLNAQRMKQISIACKNSLQDCVLAGPKDQIELCKTRLKANGVRSKLLETPYGFHSAAMEPIMASMQELSAKLPVSQPKIRLGSNFHGRLMDPGDITSEYFAFQTRHPVRFVEMLQSVPADLIDDAVIIEMGPASTTLPMIKNTLHDKQFHLIQSLNPKQECWETLSTAAIAIDSKCEAFDWRTFFDGSGAAVIDAPQYPFESSEIFVPYRGSQPLAIESFNADSNPFGLRKLQATEQCQPFKAPLSSLAPFIGGHVVCGTAFCPASVYYQLIMEAIALIVPTSTKDSVNLLEAINFYDPLVYEDPASDVQLSVNLHSNTRTADAELIFDQFQFGREDKQYAGGKIRSLATADLQQMWVFKGAMVQRRIASLGTQRDMDTFSTRLLYETVFPRVVDYSKDYHTIVRLTATNDGSEGTGTFRLQDQGYAHFPPAFVDTLLHAAGFIANTHVSSKEVCICAKVESIAVLEQEIELMDTFTFYCELTDTPNSREGKIASAYALKPDGTIVAAVEGMHFKRLNLRSFSSHVARQTRAQQPGNEPMRIKQSIATQSHAENIRSTPSQRLPNLQLYGAPVEEVCEWRKSLEEGIIDLTATLCEVSRNSISSESSLTDLGFDSLAQIELCEAIQQRWPNVDIGHSDLIGSTISDIQTCVVKNAVSVAPTPPPGEPPKGLYLQLPPNGFIGRRNSLTPPDSPTTGIKTIIHELCGISRSELQATTTLESLGIDSLLQIELGYALEDAGIGIPESQISEHLTLDDLAGLVRFKNAVQPDPNRTPMQEDIEFAPIKADIQLKPISLQSSSRLAAPLYLFHDGSGMASMYSKLSDLDRTVFGIANPGFGQDLHWASGLADMAARYASQIAAATLGPVCLGGWSFGGVLAHEVAQHLHAAGVKVNGVVLIDSPSPINHKPLPGPVIQHVLQSMYPSPGSKAENTLCAQFSAHASFLGSHYARAAAPGMKYALLLSEETMNTTQLCGVPYPWLESEAARKDSVEGWRMLTGGQIAVLDIPGNHFEPFSPKNIATTSAQLKRACDIFLDAQF